MDRNAFENDVHENLNDGLATDTHGESNDGGTFYAIGETWAGALYGYEQNTYGQRAMHMFDTEQEQADWFAGVTVDDSPANW